MGCLARTGNRDDQVSPIIIAALQVTDPHTVKALLLNPKRHEGRKGKLYRADYVCRGDP